MNYRYLFFMLMLAAIMIPAVSADPVITNSTSITTINWQWTGTPSGISNLTIDNIEVCGASPSLSSFLLTGLDPSTTHEINVTYEGNNYYNNATTLAGISGGSINADSGGGDFFGIIFGLIGGMIGVLT